jgi:diketogulonate reductase-like aldo/keto reductase
MKTITLSNGIVMPLVALGTFRTQDQTTYQSVVSALQAGYRHIDTATRYDNEEQVGQAIKDFGIARSEIFLATKVYKTEQGYEQTKQSFHDSLKRLQVDYVDLFLIHWPTRYDTDAQTWRALEEIYESGQAKAIGVCNFKIHHLEHLFQTAKIKPMVNQVECHIELQNHPLQAFCQLHNIALQAYAPLMSFHIQDLLQNPVLQELATTHQASVPQIALAWLTKRGWGSVPKSTKPERILENFNAQFIELTDTDMQRIRALNKARKLYPDADNIELT